MKKMAKFGKVARGAAIAAMLASAGMAQAGTVAVWGESPFGVSLAGINNFYNTYGGHTSSIVAGQLNTIDLGSVDLLWAIQPSDSYTAAELNTMAGFLAGGGRIAFMGEHGQIAQAENLRINDALTFLGSTISIQFNVVQDGGFRSASKLDGQIKTHALTEGVETYQYAAFAPLNVAGTGEILMTGEDVPGSVMMAYQNIGPGSIFLITDQNVWDGAGSLWGGFDNEVMFDNLVEGKTGAPPVGGVPEPTTWAMMIAGMALTGGMMRRRRTTVSFA
jgi:hypothetical protein